MTDKELRVSNKWAEDNIKWIAANCTKEEVQEIYSITKEDNDEVYYRFNEYFDLVTEEEAREAIRSMLAKVVETEVAPLIETGRTEHSLFKGVTDEEHARYSLENILKGNF